MIRKMLNAIVAVSMASSMVILAFVPQTEAASRKDVLVVGMATSDLISLDPAKAFEFSGGKSNRRSYI